MALRGLGGLVVAGGASLAGCYGNVTLGGADGDAGAKGRDAAGSVAPGRDSGGTSGKDAGSGGNSGRDAGKGGSDATSGTVYVDAGIYRGDGSFFVDGGAYPDAGAGNDGPGLGGADGSAGIDAAPGCAPLAACCGSLSGGSQSLCVSVAGSGDATNCAAELTELEGNGDCMGVTVLASEVQISPNRMVSDGTTLFWTTASMPGLLAMPVGGGPVTILINGAILSDRLIGDTSTFLAVDDVNVYVFQDYGILRIPKSGAPPTLLNESGADVIAATVLGPTAYWMENAAAAGHFGDSNEKVVVKSAPLLGGAGIALIATFKLPGPPGSGDIAVTNDSVVLSQPLYDFAIGAGASASAVEAGTKLRGGAEDCQHLTSDMAAVYCNSEQTGSNLRIASDGTVTDLGSVAGSSSYVVFDDTYAYWADTTIVGSIVKARKAGGGPTTVLAYDTSPTAIAVDAHSVYWSDAAGYIKSVPK